MSFVRPEVRQFVSRSRECIAGLVIAAGGFWLALVTTGVPRWFAYVVILLGLLTFITGLPRARIRMRQGGRGVVELDEGALRYLTPEGGAVLALPGVIRIEIETTAGDLFWIWVTDEGTARIPGSAAGSDKMVDALVHFPGARYEQVIAASASTAPALFIIWQKERLLLH